MTRNMARLLQGGSSKSPGGPEVLRASTSGTTSVHKQTLDSGCKEDEGTNSAGGNTFLSTDIATQRSEDLELHLSSDDELDSWIKDLPKESSPPRKAPKIAEKLIDQTQRLKTDSPKQNEAVIHQPVQVLSQVVVQERETQKETSVSSAMSGFHFSNCQITFNVMK